MYIQPTHCLKHSIHLCVPEEDNWLGEKNEGKPQTFGISEKKLIKT